MTINEVATIFNLPRGERVGYLLTDQQGKPLLHNDFLCELLLLRPEQLQNSTAFDYLPKAIVKQLSKLFRPGAAGQQMPLQIEYPSPQQDSDTIIKISADRMDVEQYGSALLLRFGENPNAAAHSAQTEQFQRSLIEFQKIESEYAGKVMHETVAQELYAIRISLQRFLLSYGYKDQIMPIKGMLNDVIAKVRDLSNNLRPAVLHDLGFTSAIDDLIFNLGCHHLAFKVNIDPRISAVSDELRYSAYRIMQEMFTRCAAHAEATTVQATLQVTTQALEMLFDIDSELFSREMKVVLSQGVGVDILNNRVALYSGGIVVREAVGKSMVEIKLCI